MNRPSFKNDYSEGALPSILDMIVDTNKKGIDGYSTDEYCDKARDMIRKEVGRDDADVHFISGGTQCNLLAITAALRPYQAVIACDSGHINVHETGAIEAAGHKVITAPAVNGKLTVDSIRRIVAEHEDEHMVKPAMVYISNATEVGTVYTLEELTVLSEACRELGLLFYMDGARLGSAMQGKNGNFTMKDLGRLCDAFYIGATKNGGMMGEAMVMLHPAFKDNFRFMIKQRGALMAKGWLLGMQFIGLFENGDWYRCAAHAVEMANRLADGLRPLADKGVNLMFEPESNLLFVSMPVAVGEEMLTRYRFEWFGLPENGRRGIRLVTSWATPADRVDAFLADLNQILAR